MNPTAEMILTDFGAKLPLDQRRRDALMNYAKVAAGDARSKQLWVEREWDLKPYEAKDLLKGNASETVWERIVKHPNGGWRVSIPVWGAVIGLSIQDYFAQERERLLNEAAERERSAAKLGEVERQAAAVLVSFVPRARMDAGLGAVADRVDALHERRGS